MDSRFRHRSTGIKVYHSDINNDTYGSEQNGANHLLKVIFTINWHLKITFVDYIVSPLSEKMHSSLNHSFKRFVQSCLFVQ